MLPSVVLPQGSRIHNCRIERRLGKGGFGITYLATEFAVAQAEGGFGPELRQVAIKEFFPNGIAARENGHTVSPLHEVEGAAEAFTYGLRAFYREAQAIAGLDHENVIRLLSVFEANGTAYFIMPYLKGESLHALLKREGTLSEERARRLLLPVLDGLAHAHAKGILHRDIKPDNVMIREDDARPVLIDFGTARALAATDSTRYTRLTDLVAYTPGYAALEQYSRAANDNRHGPWTDLYACGAMLCAVVTGKAPPEAAMRIAEMGGGHPDPLLPVSAQLQDAPGYGRAFLMAIDWALELAARDRPQSVNELRDALNGRRMPPESTLRRLEAQGVSTEPFTAVAGLGGRTETRLTAYAQPIARTAPQWNAPVTQPPPAAGPGPEAPPPAPASPAPRKTAVPLIAGAVVVLALVIGALLLLRQGRSPAPPAAAVPAAASPAPAPAIAAPAPAASPPVQTPVASDALAKATQAGKDAQALLQRAGAVVAQEGGKPELVLAAAQSALDAAAATLARGDAAAAGEQYGEASSLIRTRLRAFLEQLIAGYSRIAAKQMEANELNKAQQAIDKAKELKQLEAEFQ